MTQGDAYPGLPGRYSDLGVGGIVPPFLVGILLDNAGAPKWLAIAGFVATIWVEFEIIELLFSRSSDPSPSPLKLSCPRRGFTIALRR
jgi:hypothetical protein